MVTYDFGAGLVVTHDHGGAVVVTYDLGGGVVVWRTLTPQLANQISKDMLQLGASLSLMNKISVLSHDKEQNLIIGFLDTDFTIENH